MDSDAQIKLLLDRPDNWQLHYTPSNGNQEVGQARDTLEGKGRPSHPWLFVGTRTRTRAKGSGNLAAPHPYPPEGFAGSRVGPLPLCGPVPGHRGHGHHGHPDHPPAERRGLAAPGHRHGARARPRRLRGHDGAGRAAGLFFPDLRADDDDGGPPHRLLRRRQTRMLQQEVADLQSEAMFTTKEEHEIFLDIINIRNAKRFAYPDYDSEEDLEQGQTPWSLRTADSFADVYYQLQYFICGSVTLVTAKIILKASCFAHS